MDNFNKLDFEEVLKLLLLMTHWAEEVKYGAADESCNKSYNFLKRFGYFEKGKFIIKEGEGEKGK